MTARPTSATGVLAARLAAHRLTATPPARAADVVRLMGAFQSQERDHPFWSLAERSDETTLRATRAAHSRGEFLRTHILRPTWHFVAPEDLRWMLAVTTSRVEPKLAGRHRQLGLEDPKVLDSAIDRIASLISEGGPLTRAEIGERLRERGDPITMGEQLGHVILVAELRAVLVSGPLKGVHHSYALVDDVVPPEGAPDPEEGVVRLLERFLQGHGPSTDRDFARWSSHTLATTRRALATLADRLEHVDVDGQVLWLDPDATCTSDPSRPETFLLPVWDELPLTHPDLGPPQAPGHPAPQPHGRPDVFDSMIVHRGLDVGRWRRKVEAKRVVVEVDLAGSLDADDRDAVASAAQRLADFHERPLDLRVR